LQSGFRFKVFSSIFRAVRYVLFLPSGAKAAFCPAPFAISLLLFSAFRIPSSEFLKPLSAYYSFIVLSNEFINSIACLFARAAPLEPAMVVFYNNTGIYDNLKFYFFTIPSDETGLESTQLRYSLFS